MFDKLKNHPKIILGLFVLLVAISITLVSLVNRSQRTAYVPGKTSAVGPWMCSDTFSVETPLATVNIDPGQINASICNAQYLNLSALAYDNNGKPIFSGVTYDWSISSLNSVGSITPTSVSGDLAKFFPLNAGTGDLTVTAHRGAQSASKSIVVSVSGQCASPSPTPTPTAPYVVLHSAAIDGSGNLVVTYSKNFSTCAYSFFAPPPTYNYTTPVVYACAEGANLTVNTPLGTGSDISVGSQIRLCHGNNMGVCSEFVTVTESITATPTPTPSTSPSPSASPSSSPGVSPTPTPSSSPNTSPSPTASPTNIASLLLQVGLEAVTSQRADQQMQVVIKDNATNTLLMPPQIKTFTSGISGLYSNFSEQITGIPLTTGETAPQVVTICITSPSYLTNCYANKFLYPGSNTIDVSTDYLLAGDAINAGSSANRVDYFDFNNIYNNFGCNSSAGATPPPNKSCNSFKSDLDFDGDIDLYDYNYMMGNYGTVGDQ